MNSYWLNSGNELIKTTQINKDCEADVCIIGAGIVRFKYRILFGKKWIKSDNNR